MKAHRNSVFHANDVLGATSGLIDRNAAEGVSVTVRLASLPVPGQGALAVIYNINSGQISNPHVTDANGNYVFKATSGIYDVVIDEGGRNIVEPSIDLTDGPTSIVDLFGNSVGSGGDDTQAFISALSVEGRHIVADPLKTYIISQPVFAANNTTFDGRGCTIKWTGNDVTQDAGIGRDVGVFNATGTLNGLIESVVTSSVILDGTAVNYPITTPTSFVQDNFIILSTGDYSTPNYFAPQNFLCQILTTWTRNAVDHMLQCDYKLGWDIPSGSTMYYYDTTPAKNVVFKSFTLIDESTTLDETKWACGVVFKYAKDCLLENVLWVDGRLPMLHALWTMDCKESRNEVRHPRSVGGGEGYGVQWQYSQRFTTEASGASGARHLVDATGSAYGTVTNSHDYSTANGSFITHGQFEHDIHFSGISGLMSIANSDAIFGESAKRITVDNSNLTQFFCENFVSDLTMRDVNVVETASIGNDGNALFNDDGLVLENFVCAGEITLTNRSNLSKRKKILTNVTASKLTANDFTFPTSDLTINDSTIDECSVHWAGFKSSDSTYSNGLNINNALNLTSDVNATITNCEIDMQTVTLHGNNMRGYETVAANCVLKRFVTNPIPSGHLTMNGGEILNETSALIAAFNADQRIILNHTDTDNTGFRVAPEDGASGLLSITGGDHTGQTNTGAFIDLNSLTASTATVRIKLSNADVNWDGSHIIESNSFSTINNKHIINIESNNLRGGEVKIFDNATADGSLQYNNNTHNNVTMTISGSGGGRSINGNTLNNELFPARNRTVPAAYLVKTEDNGVNLVANSASDLILTFPDGLVDEFEVFALNLGAGSVGVAVLGTDTMRLNDALSDADGVNGFTKVSPTIWQRV